MIQFRFQATVIYWRGPAPFFFAPIPEQYGAEIRQMSKLLTYGWGVIPVEAKIGGIEFYTSLFPKDGTYLLPVKTKVRQKNNITAGDTISVEMAMQPRER